MKPANDGGFTLIESVISLMLLSFITIIGYQGLIFGVNQWRNGHDKMQFQYDYHQALGWMRNKLGSAEKVVSPNANKFSYLFDGTAQDLEFVGRYERARRGGLYVSRLVFDKSDNSLYVSYYLHHPDVVGKLKNSPPRRVTLLSNVVSLRLSYYGRKLGGKVSWHDNWHGENSLPQLLNIEIETVDGITHQSLISVLTSNNV